MTTENHETPAIIGQSATTLSRRFSVVPMMDWTYSGRMPSIYGVERTWSR
ncbi:hypothetical protein ALQ57_102330 [Pseudomonas amygdali pv. hibisci]|uniref:Uncharacterized protein n=3 Tax=Pseudomonas amygdali TaxID=47877 RepID=A0AAX1VZ83_PSEAJ|nr:tRNA-dihydrouridine synthase [Pseudomonas amygdali pv. lachrymans]KPX54324.1 hypothetical protein ALO67_102280 [Pseudomonas amygdali pv. hibisci]KPY77519.1 hypothetical protein ALO60_102398 [Pseudomonas amygdali pv. tabaci]KPX70826.1 hypothetical protein ALO35_103025 [Pseudomonas amygdali pv. lachrymans]RML83182.1 hypothetical protein ALQ89_100921 [Pseudomonas amygdali pv. tabaci]